MCAFCNFSLIDLVGYVPKPDEFRETLADARWEIDGYELVRSQSMPEHDNLCGRYLTYRQLIECGLNAAKHKNPPDLFTYRVYAWKRASC